jgi:hypothetical protein
VKHAQKGLQEEMKTTTINGEYIYTDRLYWIEGTRGGYPIAGVHKLEYNQTGTALRNIATGVAVYLEMDDGSQPFVNTIDEVLTLTAIPTALVDRLLEAAEGDDEDSPATHGLLGELSAWVSQSYGKRY